MKQIHLLTAALVITSAVAFTSCKPSRVWETKDKDRKEKNKDKHEEYTERRRDDYEDDRRYSDVPPPPRTYSSPRSYSYTPLVIAPTAGFVMNRYPDGRFYHRSPQGFLYWKAYDNRFFLDKAYIHRVRYNRDEY